MQDAEAHLTLADPQLAAIIKLQGPCTLQLETDLYASLMSSIISQQLSVKAADTIWKRTFALFDGKLPEPTQLEAISVEQLQAAGLSNAKARYVKDLAEHILDGRLDLEQVSTLSNQEIIEELTAVKGIGEWTAHMFLIFSLGRLDVLAWGDLGVRAAIKNVYNLEVLPTPTQVAEIAEEHSWAPFESIACWYLWRSLDNAPKA